MDHGRLLVDLLLILPAVPVAVAALYLLLLTLLSSAMPVPAAAAVPRRRYVVVVPAHDEAAGIARAVRSLCALDWPAALRRVLVIADNCSDATASLARAAGAEVIERQDPARRGKGYALRLAYDRVLGERWADAIVVVDADTEATPNLLAAFDARLQAGEQALQAFYGVRNPDASWRTRLVTIALALMHRLRSRGRERLAVSVHLRGNGMCFTADLLRRIPCKAYSLVEDLEFSVELAAAGVRVAYADEAAVYADMAATAAAAGSQRQRWEGGRAQIARRYALPLLRAALMRRSALRLDMAMELLVPPLASVAMAAAGLLGAAAWAVHAGAADAGVLLLPLAAAAMLMVYVLRGVALSGLGARGWMALAAAPVFVVWKLALRLRGGASRSWVRTQREPSGARGARGERK